MIMSDLIQHIENDNLVALFPSDYNHIIRTLYIVIRRAFLDKANSLSLEVGGIIWKKDNKKVGEFQFNHPAMFEGFREGLYKILDRDELVQDSLRVISDDDRIICELKSFEDNIGC